MRQIRKELGEDGQGAEEISELSEAITKAARDAFDLHVRRPCRMKQVKIGGGFESREEAEIDQVACLS